MSTQTSPPTPLMAGYLESWESLSLTAAAEAGYTCVILAFGSVDGTQVELYQNSFPPDNGQDGTLDPTKLKNDVAGALGAGATQVLVSFGGANNTFLPGSASAADVGAAIVTFLRTYGFTGCDFDLEISTDGSYLQELIQAIKDEDDSLIVTAAPQLNHVDSAVAYVTTGTDTDYDEALKAGLFDYLFVQAYNTCCFNISDQTEQDVGFISAAFGYLESITPIGTKICIGEPATGAAAGECSVYHGPNAGSQIYKDMADQYQSIASSAQFGGAMTWSVNADQGNNYAFVKAVGPVIAAVR